MSARIRGKSQLSIAREGFLDRRSKRCFWLLLSPQTKVARAGARNYPCAAAADSSEGRGWCADRFWRLSNRAHCGAKHRNGSVAANAAGVWERRLRAGRGTKDPSSVSFAVPPVSLRVGRSAGLTRHRRVIQHREPLKGKANGGASSGGTCLPAGRSVHGSDRPPACHSIPRTSRGKAWGIKRSARGRFFWLCLSLFAGAGQARQGQE